MIITGVVSSGDDYPVVYQVSLRSKQHTKFMEENGFIWNYYDGDWIHEDGRRSYFDESVDDYIIKYPDGTQENWGQELCIKQVPKPEGV